ncbi:MAG: hypothetical protein IT245_00130, partial [Bacteroidia bacterium]|nr:hypothetical protein [Bacteroidia bacterium]
LNSFGQSDDSEVYDTAKRLDPLAATADEVFRSFSFKNPMDSSMLFFSQYDRIKRENVGIQNTGDIGMPYINQTFNISNQTGFYTGFNPYGDQFFKSKDLILHSARLPYTEFRFAQGKSGQRGLIDFNALHTQNFGENIGITIKYHSVAYDGFYTRQSTVNKNLLAGMYFRSRNKRYLAIGSYAWNKATNFENGGMEKSSANDSFFRELQPSVRIVDVMLNNAKSINRLSELKFQHAYSIIRKDSIGLVYLAHHFLLQRQSNYYTDLSSDFGYYDSVFYFNNDASTDSIGYQSYSNALEIFTPINEKGLAFKAGIQYDNFSYRGQAENDNYFVMQSHNTSIYSQFNFDFLNVFNSQASGRLYLEGFNAGDYQLEWNNQARISEAKGINLNAQLNLGSRHPGYQQTRQLSNHYVYQTNFENTAYKSLQIGLDKKTKRPALYNAYSYALPNKQYGAFLNYHLIDNYIYYGQNGLPNQGSKGQSCLQFRVFGHLNLKKFQFHQEFTTQAFSKQLASQVLLPSWLTKGSYYFQTYAFKKASFIQIGFDATFSASYKARIYNPAIMQFQLSEGSVGAYPFVDFFINAEVKTARIFFKMEHINADLPNPYFYSNYLYVTPFYPAPPRRFRLGFAWKFYY